MHPAQLQGDPVSGPGEGQKPVDDDDLSLVDVARLLHVSINTVARWAGSGRIQSAVVPGGIWRFRLKDVNTVSIWSAETGDVTPTE